MEYSFNVGPTASLELAEEVLSSAARILLLAGFSKTDVGVLFRDAASSLAAEIDEDEDRVDSEGDQDNDDNYSEEDEDKIYTLEREFDALPCNKKLERLHKRAEAIDEIDDGPKIEKVGKILSEAVPLRVEAMAWLSQRAERLGLQIHGDRNTWIEGANDDELDKEDEHVFLDDYRWKGPFSWNVVASLARKLAALGQTDALESLHSLTNMNELNMDEYVCERVREAKESAALYLLFDQHVQSYSGRGEQMQSEFIDEFSRVCGGARTMYVEEWLNRMSDDGRIERYKRSNRWRVLVP